MDLKQTPGLFSVGVTAADDTSHSSGLFINQDHQDEEASDCPLLTPSPPPDSNLTCNNSTSTSMFNPLENTCLEMTPVALDNLNNEDALKAFMNIVNSNSNNIANDEPSSRDPMVESSSSEESSVNKEPVCTQLLTQLNTAYQHLAPDAQAIFCNQETSGKPPLVGIQLVVPKPPKDYSFTRWDWPRIRKICFWAMICLLTICTTFAIRGIVFMPRRCDPPTEWWQGKLFYEIFPASFQDSSKGGDGIGDFRGIIMRINYLKNLGVNTVRLNSIFSSNNYPEHYSNINSLVDIDESLGTMADFDKLIDTLHRNDINLVLDLPIYPFSRQFDLSTINKNINNEKLSRIKRENKLLNSTNLTINETNEKLNISEKNNDYYSINNTININNMPKSERYTSNRIDSNAIEDEITLAMKFWLRKKVDGFYLKGLEHFINNTNIINYLNEWRDIMGYNKILICNWNALKKIDNNEIQKKIIQTMNLIDVELKLINGTKNIKRQIDEIITGPLFNDELIENYNNHPWIHWTIGSVDTNRVISTLNTRNATFAAIVLSMMLPGIPNIFYGDEIGMDECICEDHRDLDHLHNLSPMAWENVPGTIEKFASDGVIPWLPKASMPILTTNYMRNVVIEMSKLRQNSPPIFVETALKHDRIRVNCDVRYTKDELIVIERWYPRQNTYVLVANFGNSSQTKDLSFLYYQGHIVVGPKQKLNENVYFKQLNIAPGEVYVIKLEK